MTTRRSFITGLIAFTATAPAIVRAGSLMPVKATSLRVLTPAEMGIDLSPWLIQQAYIQDQIIRAYGIDFRAIA